MKKGDIVLVHFPFTDLTGSKLRPALVLAHYRDDAILSFISTNTTHSDPFDVFINQDALNGLKKNSLLKLAKIATLESRLIAGRIGELDSQSMQLVNTNLRKIFTL